MTAVTQNMYIIELKRRLESRLPGQPFTQQIQSLSATLSRCFHIWQVLNQVMITLQPVTRSNPQDHKRRRFAEFQVPDVTRSHPQDHKWRRFAEFWVPVTVFHPQDHKWRRFAEFRVPVNLFHPQITNQSPGLTHKITSDDALLSWSTVCLLIQHTNTLLQASASSSTNQ